MPLVGLVTNGAPKSKERAASALWHLSVDSVNQQAISKAGGIAPIVQLLEEGTVQATIFAAGALDRLARDNADNQASIAKKLVSLLGSKENGAQRQRNDPGEGGGAADPSGLAIAGHVPGSQELRRATTTRRVRFARPALRRPSSFEPSQSIGM